MPKTFLCIGGPLDGQKKLWEEVHHEYWGYNRAGGDDDALSYIFIHESLVTANVGKAPKLPKLPRRNKATAQRNQDLQVWEEQREI